MSALGFEWDPAKAKANLAKHGVTFEEARSAFYDDEARVYDDPDHSDDEERFILLGLSAKLRTLVVCHCLRDDESIIHIISARKANREETESYWSSRK